MKKLLITALAIMATGATYALPVGNPSEASLLCDGLIFEGHCGDACDPCLNWCDALSLRVGFYGDYVFNRHLAVKRGAGASGDRDIEHAEIFTNAGYVAGNIWDRVDVFATFGATNIFIDTNAGIFIPGITSRIEIETATRFSWSVGARGTLWECGCTALGIEGQYFSTRPDIKRVTIGAIASDYPATNDRDDARYWEWQVGLGLSHRINMFVPYVAVKWSRVRWDLANNPVLTAILNDIRNDKHWGYAVGVSIVDCEKAALTVEGRFADEKACYVNGQIRF